MRRSFLLIFALWFTFSLILAQDEATPDEPISGTAPAPDVTPTPIPKPPVIQTVEGEGFSVDFYFEGIEQGNVGVLGVRGENLAQVRADFLNQTSDFFSLGADGFFGVLSVGIDQALREYDVRVYVTFTDNTRAELTARVQVISAGFIRQDVEIPPERAYLIDPEVERLELARLASIFETSTLERLWNGETFMLPMPSEITSPFGALRVLNGTAETRHTGWDLRATVGKPIFASASGRVIFAGKLDIRGNYVVIDHGYTIMTGYAHMSQMQVTRGQMVTRGQVLGLTGNTGRSSGPHLHWEMVVNGNWVDTVDFMRMWLP